MSKSSRKPSVYQKGTVWSLVDIGKRISYAEQWFDHVEVWQQEEVEGDILDHYRLRVNSKWVRKTFYGETAWMDVERYARDKYNVDVRV